MQALKAIRSCDLLVAVGTSLVVYPAAGFVNYRPAGAKLVIVNYDPTPYDAYADLVLHDDISAVFAALQESGCAAYACGAE